MCWFYFNLTIHRIYFSDPTVEITLEAYEPIIRICDMIAIFASAATMTFIIYREEYKRQVLVILGIFGLVMPLLM
jgi:hypothetical protein